MAAGGGGIGAATGQHEHQNGSTPPRPPAYGTTGGKKRRSLVTRSKEVAQTAWQVSKIFSPPIQHPVLRILALWLVVTRILLTFLLTLVVRAFVACMYVVVCTRDSSII
jgi:hypothetical protein